MTINQRAQPKRVINGRSEGNRARESGEWGAGSTNFEGKFQSNKVKKEKLDGYLQGFFKFHRHIFRQLWYTFMVSKEKHYFYASLSCIFLFKNAVSNPISVSGIHTGLQRILDFLRLGNNFAGEEQQMSLDSFAVPLTKKGLLNKQTLLFNSFLF